MTTNNTNVETKGHEGWELAIYQEINKPDSIVYKDHFTDAEGNVAPDMPNMIINVEFIELDDKTSQRITVNFDTNEENAYILKSSSNIY